MASAQRSLIAGSEETSLGVALCLSIPCCKIGILQRTTSTTALRGAATSLERAERRRGSILSMRFLLCTARRSVMVWRPEITAGGSIFLKFLRLTPKRGEGKQRNIIDRVGGLGGGAYILPKRWLSQPAVPSGQARLQWQCQVAEQVAHPRLGTRHMSQHIV
jgi:hypothetical protein